MKISFTVAEFNPLHLGHVKLLSRMKACGELTAVIMSGNFTQRGEVACLDKYTRAEHAVKAGADVVFELPTCFSVAPAEIFAKGAIKLMTSVGDERTLFFGTENGFKDDFITLSNALDDENKKFKAALKEALEGGLPFAAARAKAVGSAYPEANASLLFAPNAVLGLEYVRAIKKYSPETDFSPVMRDSDYLSPVLSGKSCSSLAIRQALLCGEKRRIKPFVPPYVFNDLTEETADIDKIVLFKLLESSADELKEVTDCSEGLENRIKAFSKSPSSVAELIDKLETKRYTRARLKRTVLLNALKITDDFTQKCLKADLYLKVLAVAEDKKDCLARFADDKHKLITRKSDADKLGGTARKCFDKDEFCNDVYNLISGKKTNAFEMRVVRK